MYVQQHDLSCVCHHVDRVIVVNGYAWDASVQHTRVVIIITSQDLHDSAPSDSVTSMIVHFCGLVRPVHV